MVRLILVSSSTLFLGSEGAFFLFVPALSIVTVVLMLMGLVLMFGLGFQAGARRNPHDHFANPAIAGDPVWALETSHPTTGAGPYCATLRVHAPRFRGGTTGSRGIISESDGLNAWY
jgi:hypothetical protein